MTKQIERSNTLPEGPAVTLCGVLDMQICVPEAWSDEEAERFAEQQNPAGTTHGWFMRKQGHERLSGADARVQCAERRGFVHIMLEC